MAPAKELEGKTRREKGVLAQREYRKRHTSKFKQLQEENEQLRKALQVVLSASNDSSPSDSWPPHIREAIAEANSTGSADNHTFGDSDTTLGIGKLSVSSESISANGAVLPPIKYDRHDDEGWSKNEDESFKADIKPMSEHAIDDNAEHSPSEEEAGGRYSNMNLSYYLSQDTFTLEGRLFWDWMHHIILQMQREVLTPEMLEKMRNAEAENDESEIEAVDLDYLAALNSMRLDHKFCLENGIRQETRSKYFQNLLDRQRNIYSSVNFENLDAEWKTASQAAEFLMQALQPEDSEGLLDAIIGKADSVQERQVGLRLAPIAKTAICFGDGPRWNTEFLQNAAKTWSDGSQNRTRKRPPIASLEVIRNREEERNAL